MFNKRFITKTPLFLIFLPFLFSCNSDLENSGSIQNTILNNKQSYFYIDTEKYPENDQSLPIGIFDSGTGGLTVLDVIVNSDLYNNENHRFTLKGDGEKDFESEYFIYLGDKANMPYGEYAGNNKVDLLREHIIKDVQFLLGNKYYRTPEAEQYQTGKLPVKAIVIACNTATAFGKGTIEKFLEEAELDLKVIGVIGAGVRGSLENLNKDEDAAIGVMATAGTVTSKGYFNTIKSQSKALEYKGNIDVFQQAGIGLAAAIDGEKDYINSELTAPRENYRGPSFVHPEASIDKSILARYNFDWSGNKVLYEGKKDSPSKIQLNSVENYISYHLVSLLERMKKSGEPSKLRSLILGCTHYPFYMDIFKQKLKGLFDYKENGKFVYRKLLSENVEIIDPALNTSKELYQHLKSENLYNTDDLTNSEFFISVPNKLNENVKLNSEGGFPYDYKYGRSAGEIQEYVKRVPFSKRTISEDVLNRLKNKIPFTFKLIRSFNSSNSKTNFLTPEEKL